MMPISCQECRRRKIKCNKSTPCNQCTIKDRVCEYPDQFRSVGINKLIDKRDITKSFEIENALKENEMLKMQLKNAKLNMRRMKERIKKNWGSLDTSPTKHDVISYYGPTSTEYMISNTDAVSILNENKSSLGENDCNMHKQRLPILLSPQHVLSRSVKTTSKENADLIIKILNKFTHLRIHYLNYIDVASLINLVHDYEKIEQWNDELSSKLLLIVIILIVTIRSLPKCDSTLTHYNLVYAKIRPMLYKHYSIIHENYKLRTVTSLKSYLLETEDLFYMQKVEDSWSLFFLITSYSYSLGLHIYDNAIANHLADPENTDTFELVKKNDKTSLWLLINYVSSTLSSILGRPNPVSFHHRPLVSHYETNLNYKIALSELIKYSTNVMIDSYKIKIEETSVYQIDETFVQNAMIYERILTETQIIRESNTDKHTNKYITIPIPFALFDTEGDNILHNYPLDISFLILKPCESPDLEESYCLIQEDSDTLCDLILLYANRAKFNQHFMKLYPKTILNALTSSIKVLEIGIRLVNLLLKKMKEANFKELYPFVFILFYQTFVVICTIFYQDFKFLQCYYKELNTLKIKIANFLDIYADKDIFNQKIGKLIQYIYQQYDVFYKSYEKENNSNAVDGDNLNHTDAPPDLAESTVLSAGKTYSVSQLLNFTETDEKMQLDFDISDPFFIQNPSNFS